MKRAMLLTLRSWRACWKKMAFNDLYGYPLWETQLHDVLQAAFPELRLYMAAKQEVEVLTGAPARRGRAVSLYQAPMSKKAAGSQADDEAAKRAIWIKQGQIARDLAEARKNQNIMRKRVAELHTFVIRAGS